MKVVLTSVLQQHCSPVHASVEKATKVLNYAVTLPCGDKLALYDRKVRRTAGSMMQRAHSN